MKQPTLLLFVTLFLSSFNLYPQYLQPGFDKAEYGEMLKIAQKQHVPLENWDKDSSVAMPEQFQWLYRSPVVGLENVWDLWVHKTKRIAVISVRGTVNEPNSWLPNLYAAMVVAKGQLKIDKTFTFNYNLSEDPAAAVHVGWLLSTAFMSRDIVANIQACYQKGIREFILTGHSQGGGITYLLTAYLEGLKRDKQLPADIRFKTYAGAATKPGNLYFAYSYEKMTQAGWSYNVVNTADWVPEVPFSIQTKYDFGPYSIFSVTDNIISKQKGLLKPGMRHVYRKLTRPGIRAQKNYEKYMGRMMSKTIRKLYPDFVPPKYFKSNNYVRTGNTIVLYADEDYFLKFPNEAGMVWKHHFIKPYLYLLNKLNDL